LINGNWKDCGLSKIHIPERREEIERLREKVETPKHPDFASWSEMTFGFKSSYSIEDLIKADDEQLLQYLRKPIVPQNEHHYPFVGFLEPLRSLCTRILIELLVLQRS